MKKLLITLIFFSSILFSFARGGPESLQKTNRLVNDFGDFLSPEEEQALEYKLLAFNDSTSSQITIVTIKGLDGWDIAMYATKLGTLWGIGQEKKDNGIVILASKEDRKVFIATGSGMEGAVPDAIAKRIVMNYTLPNFKQGNYYAGFDETAEILIGLTKGEYTADDIKEKKGIPFWIVLIVVAVLLWIMSKANKNDGYQNSSGGGPIFMPMGRGGSFGGSSSSGFGGFGGGSFGGGGAGGSW